LVIETPLSGLQQVLTRVIGAGVAAAAGVLQSKTGIEVDVATQMSITLVVYGVAHKLVSQVFGRLNRRG
jgi:hypothetical protein